MPASTNKPPESSVAARRLALPEHSKENRPCDDPLHAFRVMAIDAERRNCYLTDGQLQPFDVILCMPDEEMERYLGIYPSE